MFDRNNIDMEQDRLFRSILDEGQEAAPEYVWGRIEEDLDRLAQRRKVVLWFRRTAVGVAAAAALALGLFHDWGGSGDIVSPVSKEGMIAVVEQQNQDSPEQSAVPSEIQETKKFIAAARTDKTVISAEKTEAAFAIQSETSEHMPDAETEDTVRKSGESGSVKKSDEKQSEERFPDIWPEDETDRHMGGISLVLSGVTGTNSAQNSNRVNPMRRPGISAAPQKTGVKETSTNTAYGIPVSVGVGVKFDFAPKWSLATGLNYTLLNRKFYGTYTEIGSNGSILRDISSDIRGSQHYLGIPINVYYDVIVKDHMNFYVYAGGTLEKCIADKYQVLSTNIVHTDKVKGLQVSANLGMGVEFMVARHLGIYLDPSLRYYFECNQPKSIRTAQPLMFGFEMGLRFRL